MVETTATQWGVVLGASLLACISDLRTRRIPDALTVSVAVGGLAYATWNGGIIGLGESVAAGLLLALPYFLLFAVAGGGAGDAKMMGALGLWLGLRAGLIVLGAVGATGALFGLLSILVAPERKVALARLYACLYVAALALTSGPRAWRSLPSGPAQEKSEKGGRNGDQRLTIPYGAAMFIGACIGAWVVHAWN